MHGTVIYILRPTGKTLQFPPAGTICVNGKHGTGARELEVAVRERCDWLESEVAVRGRCDWLELEVAVRGQRDWLEPEVAVRGQRDLLEPEVTVRGQCDWSERLR